MKKKLLTLLSVLVIVVLSIMPSFASERASSWNGDSNTPYEEINGNMPYFTESEKKRTDKFENYSSLDSLGRCGVAFANICKEIMPTDSRESIGSVKPTGWQTPSPKYDFISGKYLYNRCHLIAFELAGENDNKKNLITGTRYLNIVGMLPFENDTAKYVKKTGNHVLYRVTPIFKGNNLVAEGVRMEGWSVEDKGKGICFNVFCYNVQPNVTIDYATGQNRESGNGESNYNDPFYSDSSSKEETSKSAVIYNGGSGNSNSSSKSTKKVSSSDSGGGGIGWIILIIIIIIYFSKRKKRSSGSSSSSSGSGKGRTINKRK